MLVGLEPPAERNGLGLACGLLFGIGIDAHGQPGRFLAGFLRRRLRMLPEVLANHGCAHVEAELVFLDPRNDVEDFMAVLVESDRLGGIALPGVAGDHQLLADHHARYDRDVVFGSLEADAQLVSDLAALRLGDCQLAAYFDAGRLHQLVLTDAHPGLRAGHAMAGMFLRGVEPRAPGLGGSVQFVQVGDRLEAQSRFELALDEVPGVLHLAGHPRGTGLVDDDADAQRTAKVPGHGRGVGRTWVHHQNLRHAMQNVVATALLHGVDQHITQVLAALGAHDVLHVDPIAGVLGDLVRPDPVRGDAGHVLRLVLVELVMLHDAQAVTVLIGAGLEVIKNTQRGIDLPNVVRVTASQLAHRSRLEQLLGMNPEAVESPGYRADGQRPDLARVLVNDVRPDHLAGP